MTSKRHCRSTKIIVLHHAFSHLQLVFGTCGVLQGISKGKGYVDLSSVDVETINDVHEVCVCVHIVQCGVCSRGAV